MNSQKTFAEIKILERNHAFDAMRFFGVLIIILAHSGPPSWLFQIRNFGTPLLIISSALAHNYIYQHRSFVWKKYYKKRFKRLIIPAWIFLIIFFISGLFICLLFDIKFPFSTKNIVYSFMFWSGIGYVWIFKVYIILALITPLSLYINNYIDDNKKLLLCLTILYFIYEIIYILLSPILEGHLKGIFDEGIFIVLPFSLIYIYGMRLDRLSTRFVIFNAALCLFTFIIIAILLIYGEGHFVQTQNFKYPPRIYYFSYSLFSIHIIYLIVLKYEKLLKNNFISWLSSNSLWIYLWHIYALYMIKYIHILDNNNSFNFIIKFIFIMLFSISFTYLQSCRVSPCLSKSNNLFLKDLSSYLK